MRNRSVRWTWRFLALPLLAAVLWAAGIESYPVSAEPCAESVAGNKASMLYTEGKSQDALPYAYQTIEFA